MIIFHFCQGIAMVGMWCIAETETNIVTSLLLGQVVTEFDWQFDEVEVQTESIHFLWEDCKYIHNCVLWFWKLDTLYSHLCFLHHQLKSLKLETCDTWFTLSVWFLFILQEFTDNLIKDEELPAGEKEKFQVQKFTGPRLSL